jgi:hypothetical protein
LGAFVVLRAHQALFQVRAFSLGRYRVLGAFAIALLAMLVGFGGFFSTQQAFLGALIVGASVLLFVSSKGSAMLPVDGLSKVPGFLAWLTAISRARGAVRVGAALVDAELSVSRYRLAQRIADGLDGQVSWWGRRVLLWYERPGGPDQASQVPLRAGGCLREVTTSVADGGLAALANLLKSEKLSPPLRSELVQAKKLARSDLGRQFEERFGGCPQLSFAGPGQGESDDLPLEQVAGVMAEIRRATRGAAKRRRTAGPDVAVYCPNGRIERIFLMDRERFSAEVRGAWRREVALQTLAASTGIHGEGRL